MTSFQLAPYYFGSIWIILLTQVSYEVFLCLWKVDRKLVLENLTADGETEMWINQMLLLKSHRDLLNRFLVLILRTTNPLNEGLPTF